ncbi:hypothetical protein F3Y22_tig00111402pilonHSYRG01218 [Hibiscus syriacus]|uniref:Aminotransferase class I/classII large domain-containing protein n=1 Tax=Hibiscus syriacus TaxID=106335 RepID=A0A6A2XUX5_HIBSY|nr:hypothetical protein F3Y22_tig00111402pilonHSYRG01218 [Hibiscus syriacus]
MRSASFFFLLKDSPALLKIQDYGLESLKLLYTFIRAIPCRQGHENEGLPCKPLITKVFTSSDDQWYYLIAIQENIVANDQCLSGDVPAGAIVLLHACAHNPMGVDPTIKQREQIIQLIRSKGLLPFFDSANQGFVSGNLDANAQHVRMFTADGGNAL